jgi:hypothetical protein
MINVMHEDNERLQESLADLRQLIMRVEPAVMFDGRFEEMITNPTAIIDVARQLIRAMPARRQGVGSPLAP